MATWDGFDYANIIANRQKDTFIHGFLDISGSVIITKGDVSINSGNLFVNYDASINGNLVVNKTLTTTGNLITNYDASINGNLVVNKTLTTTGNLITNYDASINGNLVVNKTLTTNGNLFIKYDTSLNGNLTIGKTITTTSFINTYDASINGNLIIGKDILINGNLSVKQYTAQTIINTTTTNYQLIISEDISLNGRLFVLNDASLNGNCCVKTRLGVGVTSPQYTVDISSASTQPFRVGIGATNAIVVSSTGKVGIGSATPIVALDVNGAVNINNGFVGIGTTNPSTPLHIAANTINVTSTGARYFNTTTALSTGISSFNNIVAYMEGSIVTNQSFIGINTVTFSDERIKKNIMSLTDVQSTTLQKFREIQPKIFQYIDNFQYGNIEQYGFIAQEIENILPSAIQYHTLYIPNIYDTADFSRTTLTLHKTSTNQFEYDASNNLFTKLKCYDGSNNEYIVNIKSIINDTTFEIELPQTQEQQQQQQQEQIFVYGQEVNNYRTINYDTLFMLSFFATQELDKEVRTLKDEIANVFVKLNDIATNCCNIEQEFHP